MWIGKGNPVLVHSEEMSYVDLHQGIFHFTQEQWAAQMESVKSLFPRFSCSLWHPSHRSKNWVSITKKRHRNQKINTPALCCLSANPKSSSQDMELCGHTLICSGGFQQPFEGVTNRWDHRHLQARRSTSQSCQTQCRLWIFISNSGSVPCCDTQLPFATFN